MDVVSRNAKKRSRAMAYGSFGALGRDGGGRAANFEATASTAVTSRDDGEIPKSLAADTRLTLGFKLALKL
jgi:hypothetical protein